MHFVVVEFSRLREAVSAWIENPQIFHIINLLLAKKN